MQGALGLLRPQKRLICPAQIFLHSSCRRSGECHWCQQEGRCPPHPPGKGQAAGEQWGVTQTGKLSGTQPFPAGTGKRHSGSHSGPKLGVLAATVGTSKHQTEPTLGCPSHQALLRVSPPRTRSFPDLLNLKTRACFHWEAAVGAGQAGDPGGIQRLGLQGPCGSCPGRSLVPQHRNSLMPRAQHLPGLRDREWSSAMGRQGKAETGGASLQTERTEATS